MLRLISIIGIAIAMVIGFVAISSKMKDDYTARTRIVDVIEQMKTLATDELLCGENKDASMGGGKSGENTSSENAPEVEISKDLEPVPLIESPESQQTDTVAQAETLSSETQQDEQQANEAGNDNPEKSEDSGSSIAESNADTGTKIDDNGLDRNADIIKTMGYRKMISGSVEVIVIFKDIIGESGKTLVTSGSQLAIQCACDSASLSCNTVKSNINKNYLPKSLTKQ